MYVCTKSNEYVKAQTKMKKKREKKRQAKMFPFINEQAHKKKKTET